MSYKITAATLEDLPALVYLAGSFLETSKYGAIIPFDVDTIRGFVEKLLETGGAFIARDETGDAVGMIGLVSFRHVWSGEHVAEELAWYVKPDHRASTVGPRLLTAGLTWARGRGCDIIRCSAPAGSDVGAFYTRRGFMEVDTTFVKRLT